MGTAIVSDLQSRANLLREMLRQDPAVSRSGVRLRDVEGTGEVLRVVVSHGARELRLERGPEWAETPLDRMKRGLKADLLRELERGSWWDMLSPGAWQGSSRLRASPGVPRGPVLRAEPARGGAVE